MGVGAEIKGFFFLGLMKILCVFVCCQTAAQAGQFTVRCQQLGDGSAAAARQTDGPVFSLR